MKLDDLKEDYGHEYPDAVIQEGIRLPLYRETRFSRSYSSDDRGSELVISKFMEGSASITADELADEWPNWSLETRIDFCQSSCWLKEQPDFPETLRYIIRRGGHYEWSAIALQIAYELPQHEAYEVLLRMLRSAKPGNAGNYAQAIAKTKHPGAESVLRDHLEALWREPGLWDADEPINFVAYNAAACIAYLIDLGVPAQSLAGRVRELSLHGCPDNRKSCQGYLSRHFPWLYRVPNS